MRSYLAIVYPQDTGIRSSLSRSVPNVASRSVPNVAFSSPLHCRYQMFLGLSVLASLPSVPVGRKAIIVQTLEFRGALIFLQADLNFYAKILRVQPEFGNINVFLQLFWGNFNFCAAI